MEVLLWIIGFSLLGGLLSVVLASTVLAVSDSIRTRMLPHLVSFAIGALLGAAFLGLLPHAFANIPVEDFHNVFLTVLIGLLGFFLLEKLVLWRHCHNLECEAHGSETETHHRHDHHQQHAPRAAATLILVGDSVHNLVDGVLIAAAFLTDIHLGIVTAIAVAAHEIPQEIGDFAVLLHGGYSRGKALLFNVLSSLTTVVGGVAAYFFLDGMQDMLPYVLAVAASSFIYIAVADLIPGLHKRLEATVTAQQFALIGAGVLVIYCTHSLMH